MAFLPPNNDGKYLGLIMSVELQDRTDSGDGIALNTTLGLMYKFNQETQAWEDIMDQNYQVRGWVNLKNSDKFERGAGEWQHKTLNVLAQVYDWYSMDFDDLLQKISDSGELIMGTVKTKGEYSNLVYIDKPTERPGRSGNQTDPQVSKALTTKYRTELKTIIQKPAAPVQKFRPKQPEPGSQPWDTPPRGVPSTDRPPF